MSISVNRGLEKKENSKYQMKLVKKIFDYYFNHLNSIFSKLDLIIGLQT
jgi:hypothetical protein